MGHATIDRGDLSVARGDDALAWATDPGRTAQWEALFAQSPWALAFQSPAFARAWYPLHVDLYEPIVITRHAGDRLTGLLAAARRRDGRSVVGVGDRHGEYQGWLETGGDFLGPALDVLSGTLRGASLHLSHLPPGSPSGWRGGRGILPRFTVVTRQRGLVDLADSSVDRSLRTSSNRSKLNRMKRLGEVALRQYPDEAALAQDLPRIAEICDRRQAALGHERPFASNPRKAPFHLALMREGLLHATTLRIGDDIASVHLDLVTRPDTVLLYTIGHDETLEAHSPGSIHLRLLAQELARTGHGWYDLSPGEGYKERFATSSEPVLRVHAETSWVGRIRSSARATARGVKRAQAAVVAEVSARRTKAAR